jgi:hypothetical protein
VSDALAAHFEQARAWLAAAHAAGWLEDADRVRLETLERRTPADLFAEKTARPLVVAFFGGTGVGKSSLLNRLASETIARVGVERPTSREVTIFVHREVDLAALPPELPVERVQVRRHAAQTWREVLWIDAPDIDSVEEANRAAALACLPVVDLVCYVVSPERYRDDAGWRVLRQRGHSHGWVFVINRWDEGDPQQLEDLSRMLAAAGFEAPLVLRTCCAPAGMRPPRAEHPNADDFDQLRTAIHALLAARGIEALDQLARRSRLEALRSALRGAAARLGTDDTWDDLALVVRDQWQRAAATLSEGIEWPLRNAAGRLAVRNTPLLQPIRALTALRQASPERAVKPADGEAGRASGAAELTADLWDAWADSKVSAFCDAMEVAAGRAGMRGAPLRRRLDAVVAGCAASMRRRLEDAVRAALSRPGTPIQRAARRVTGFLSGLLPGIALLWVAYNVVAGYFRATLGERSFLGGDFAIHSALIVLSAWLVPFVLDWWLRPSLERAAIAGLRHGLAEGLNETGRRMAEALDAVAAEARQLRSRVDSCIAAMDSTVSSGAREVPPALRRLVPQPEPTTARA